MERSINANEYLKNIISPDKLYELNDGDIIYDDDEYDCNDLKNKKGIITSQIYKFGSYLCRRVDIIFYNDGNIKSHFSVGNKYMNMIISNDSIESLYELYGKISDFIEIQKVNKSNIINNKTIQTKYHNIDYYLDSFIIYGNKYEDEKYYYRNVELSRKSYKSMINNYGDILLTQDEWHNIGLRMDTNWKHIYSLLDKGILGFRMLKIN